DERQGRDAGVPWPADEDAERPGRRVRVDGRRLAGGLVLELAAAEVRLRLELGRSIVDALAHELPLLGTHVLELVGALLRLRPALLDHSVPQFFEHLERTVAASEPGG